MKDSKNSFKNLSFWMEDTITQIFKISHDLGLDEEKARVTKNLANIIMGSAYDPLQIGAPFTLQARLISEGTWMDHIR